ncbi:cytochrome c [Novosphingobium sp. JCM 18896]|uniref:cytochrome c n=1 Tax=Novosphingobium sp. JCM 18896 TaxID=2989731 RepID=UPI002222ECE9|nr:cytochrome c [Novosphingobium sp. JCM 18896]MCW1427797.1 cytochrome c [Novosphingobium sp. JCM 18896]
MKSRHALALPALLVVAIVLTAPGAQPASAAEEQMSKAEADGIIFERQNLMLQFDKDAELLGEIAAGLKPKDKLAEVTASIAETAAASKGAFEPRVPGGRAKPEVWSNWADYSRRLDDLEKNTKQLAEFGAKGDLTSVTNMLGGALQCKECHDVYRGPKKPA